MLRIQYDGYIKHFCCFFFRSCRFEWNPLKMFSFFFSLCSINNEKHVKTSMLLIILEQSVCYLYLKDIHSFIFRHVSSVEKSKRRKRRRKKNRILCIVCYGVTVDYVGHRFIFVSQFTIHLFCSPIRDWETILFYFFFIKHWFVYNISSFSMSVTGWTYLKYVHNHNHFTVLSIFFSFFFIAWKNVLQLSHTGMEPYEIEP